VPAQTGFCEAEILIEGVKTGLTVIVMLFDVAVVGLAQAAFDVNTQVITCPFVGV
jgi:hypothetical protein